MTTSAGEFRYFTLEAVSGNDLIFLLKGPRQPEIRVHHHFLYIFETDTKKWCRIVSIGEDGTYRKQTISVFGDIGSFPLESSENSHKDTLADVMVWSPGQGKVRIETEREDYWHGKCVYTEAIRSKMFYGYFNEFHPLKLEPDDPRKDEKYLIYGIDKILEENDLSLSPLGDQVHIVHESTLHFQINSKQYLGIFLRYFLPRKWRRGVFLLFECGRSL